MGTNVTRIWEPMSHARFCGEFGVLLEFLAGKIYFEHLEYGLWLFDVGCLDKKKSTLF